MAKTKKARSRKSRRKLRLAFVCGEGAATLLHLPGLLNIPNADIVALITQEFEEIVAFVNRGEGHFERHLLFQALNPSFGSSGIELVDLDGDGDLDVLFTNGDGFDQSEAKPYHGVQWLENLGDMRFA